MWLQGHRQLVLAFYSPQCHAGASWRAADSQSSVQLVLRVGGGGGENQTVMDDVKMFSAIDLRNWTTLRAIKRNAP